MDLTGFIDAVKKEYVQPNQRTDSTEYVQTMKGFREKRNKNNGYYCLEIHYSADPEKDNDQFRAEAKKGISKSKYEQEYEINRDVTTSQVVWQEYDKSIHFRHVAYDPRYPLYVVNDGGVWSCFIFAQVTDWGQLRIVGVDMNMSELKAQPHINRAIQYMNARFPEPKSLDLICDIANKKTESMVEYTWEELLAQSFNRQPYKYAMQGKNDGAIDLVGALFLTWIINPETGRQEPKVVISNELELIDETLRVGYKYKEQKDELLPKSVQIDEVHPFEDIADCIKYLCYHIFAEHKAEQRKDERKKLNKGVSLVARYNG